MSDQNQTTDPLDYVSPPAKSTRKGHIVMDDAPLHTTVFGPEETAVFGPEETAPNNRRLLIFGHMPAGHEEMAMGWKDVLDGRWYFAPQGGLVPFTVERWCEVPEPNE